MPIEAYKLIDYTNPVFVSYGIWTSVLVLKMLYMSVHTAIFRLKNQTFATKEDSFFATGDVKDKGKVRFNDEEVNRVRRAHRNDMENILPSLIIGFLFVLTNPQPMLGSILFKFAALARILHTLVYAIIPVPQPARVLSFSVHYMITIYMAGCVIQLLW